MPDTKRPILLAAGGTGGHLFPAEALAEALTQRGRQVELVTDTRVDAWIERFPGDVHTIIAGTVTGSGLDSKIRGAWRLLKGFMQARKLIAKIKPAAVVGFGGYPTVPPILAAHFAGVPTLIHEGNAVMGRANRFLAPRVSRIATGFPLKENLFSDKTFETGNPVRRPVIHAAETAYPPLTAEGPLRILVFGGSQGARVMSEIVPGALTQLDEKLRSRVEVVQQSREEDLAEAQSIYKRHNIKAELAPFFADLPAKIAAAHLVIGRSGASTVSELAAIGRPSILVPLPGAIDQDQLANASSLASVGGAILIRQSDFTSARLATELTGLFGDPLRLPAMAKAAKAEGRLDAAERLADLVVKVAGVAP